MGTVHRGRAKNSRQTVVAVGHRFQKVTSFNDSFRSLANKCLVDRLMWRGVGHLGNCGFQCSRLFAAISSASVGRGILWRKIPAKMIFRKEPDARPYLTLCQRKATSCRRCGCFPDAVQFFAWRAQLIHASDSSTSSTAVTS